MKKPDKLDIKKTITIYEVFDKINEIIDCLPNDDKYPMRKGEKEMYAVLGIGGGIFGFARSESEAKRVRDECWNIGIRKPEKYMVSFRKA